MPESSLWVSQANLPAVNCTIVQDFEGPPGTPPLAVSLLAAFQGPPRFCPLSSVLGGLLGGRSSQGLTPGTFYGKQAVNYDFPCPSPAVCASSLTGEEGPEERPRPSCCLL